MPHFVKKFDINGVKTKQVACIELHGRPNAATKGAVGVLGMDVDSPYHEIYKCVGVMGGIYAWEVFSGGSGGSVGITPVFEVDEVVTLGAGERAYVNIDSADPSKPRISFGIPEGNPGANVIAIDEMGGDDTKTTYRMRFSDGTGYDFDVYHGHDGEDGITPHIGENGNWYIGATDTGVSATGAGAIGSIQFKDDGDGNIVITTAGGATVNLVDDGEGNIIMEVK